MSKAKGDALESTAWLTECLPPGLLNNSIQKPAQEDNAMNKSVTNLWNIHKSTSSTTPAVSQAPSNQTLAAASSISTIEQPSEDQTATTVEPNATSTESTVDSTAKSKKRSKAAKDGSSKRHKCK